MDQLDASNIAHLNPRHTKTTQPLLIFPNRFQQGSRFRPPADFCLLTSRFHRWLIWFEYRGPWFTWWFNQLPGPSIFPRTTPMVVSFVAQASNPFAKAPPVSAAKELRPLTVYDPKSARVVVRATQVNYLHLGLGPSSSFFGLTCWAERGF